MVQKFNMPSQFECYSMLDRNLPQALTRGGRISAISDFEILKHVIKANI